MNFCIKCGAKLSETDNFCINCGASIAPANEETQPVNETPVAVPAAQPDVAVTSVPQSKKPKKKKEYSNDVVGFGKYILIFLALSVPVVGLVLAIVWGSGCCKNKNVCNLARAYLVIVGAIVLLWVLIISVLAIFWSSIEEGLIDMLEDLSLDVADWMIDEFDVNEDLIDDIQTFFDDLREYGFEGIMEMYEFGF